MGAGWSSCSEDSTRAITSRSSVRRFMRVAFFQNGGKKLPGLIAERGFVVEQRLDVSGDGGERGGGARGDVGDEVALGGSTCSMRVMSWKTATAPPPGMGRDVDLEDAAGDKRGRAAFA